VGRYTLVLEQKRTGEDYACFRKRMGRVRKDKFVSLLPHFNYTTLYLLDVSFPMSFPRLKTEIENWCLLANMSEVDTIIVRVRASTTNRNRFKKAAAGIGALSLRPSATMVADPNCIVSIGGKGLLALGVAIVEVPTRKGFTEAKKVHRAWSKEIGEGAPSWAVQINEHADSVSTAVQIANEHADSASDESDSDAEKSTDAYASMSD
jgi:hypothetical protein